jgi:hypothetical protein
MDMKEVEKYRPIPRGGLKLLAGVAVIALACVGIGFLLEESTTVAWAWLSAGGSFTTMLTVGAFVLGLGDYLRRNVTGYNVWFWRDEEQKIRVSFTRRNTKEDRDSSPLPCPVIKVPLGGWLNSTGCVYRLWFGKVGRAQGWRVRFPSDPWRNALSPHVTLINAEGHSVTLGIGIALDFCEYYFTGDRTTEWLLPVDVMLGDIKRLTAERDEAKKRIETVQEELRRAESQVDCWLREACKWNAVIREAIVRLDATKRFVKSKQGREVREWLAARLKELDPMGSYESGAQARVSAQDAGA